MRTYKRKYDDSRSKVIEYYKRNARVAKRSFDLTEEQFFDIVQKPCRYCGRQHTAEFTIKSYHGKLKTDRSAFKFTGVDRLNSEQGYTLTNSVPCCKNCNIAKRELTEEEFLKWIQAIITFNITKQC